MSRIPLTNGFSLMPEGEHVLKIDNVEYKEDFGKVKLTMVTVDGKKHFENYTLFDNDGNAKDAACGAFSALARAAMRDSSLEDIDPIDLKGCFLKGTLSYRTYEDKDGNNRKTTQKEPGTWWEEVTDDEISAFESNAKLPVEKKQNEEKVAPSPEKKKANYDLAALLGR